MLDEVERLHAVEHSSPSGAANPRGIGDEQDGIALGAELHALVVAGQESVAPVAGLKGLTAATGNHHHKSRQVLVFRAESVRRPSAKGGTAWLLVAGVKEGDGRIMVDGFGVDGSEEADVVRNFP